MTSLKFGTSGLRGLVDDLVGEPSRLWTLAFLGHLRAAGSPHAELLIGYDLRASSPQIAADCALACRAAGIEPVDCGPVPTPALALAAAERRLPAIMVTGSHIPDDRNGLKFYSDSGEITKADEAGIRAAAQALSPAGRPGDETSQRPMQRVDAIEGYERRYVSFFGEEALSGLRIGVYQHSSVGRDVLANILSSCGATVEPLGRSDRFLPVDTEAHRDEDVAAIAGWAATGRFDAIVSADGDADRPLVADEAGAILRGDVIGLLTARHLGIATIVTPATSSSAIERSGIADTVLRTKVGSPFVIEAMERAVDEAPYPIAGFEANGGFLLGTDLTGASGVLSALKTRDAMLPILAVLAETAVKGIPLSKIVADLAAGHTAAHRLTDVPADASALFLDRLANDVSFRERFFSDIGKVETIECLDGVRVGLEGECVFHYRASGNAPELRCYVEAENGETARRLLRWGLDSAGRALGDMKQP